ncbi:insulinase family protein [Aestuariibacter halophilus]|uniref:Insulinase family protein n=1 Tax=Fluctibacter halophilus TaxID=226011 RepID=A0ABS8G873_9ALTE|nr:pitrilysin family protein [Aestuariibacter halophilus]MCC2616733.1 insulinase family protein [Aestuariibacter halophilus]
MRHIFVGLCALAVQSCTWSTAPSLPLPEGVSLLETVVSDDEGLSIPYQKFRLDNGLTVILHPDDSDPLVHVDVTYHVGSAREALGKSGFAHFFEHMMFQGSKHVADEQHFQIVTQSGGDMNGSTNRDRTNYYQTVPANQLEKVLWLESDRMGFLLDAVTQEKFEIQRDTVKNERAQRVDNQPYGLRSERNAEALYPADHPYSWPTIGYVSDLDAVDVNDLKAFFQRWYGPNNAVVTIGGDFDTTEALTWIKQYFGDIPAGPEVSQPQPQPVTLSADRYVTLEDNVHLPLIQMTFPTVYARHEDEAALDVLANILGGGKTSLFYQHLVKPQHAVQAVVSHPCEELACEFQLFALANPATGPALADLQSRIEQIFAVFEQRGVEPDDLARTKMAIRTDSIFGLQSVAGKVSELAHNEVFFGQPDLVQDDLDRYASVTADDVMGVYRRYIKGKAKVVLSIVPQGQSQWAAAPANYVPVRALPDKSEAPPALVATPTPVTFDRTVIPPAGKPPVVTVPDYWQHTLENGIKVIGHYSQETPTVDLVLSLEGGPLLDPIDKAGLASMTALMMNEAIEGMSNEALANELELLGSHISFSAQGRYTQITLSSLRENVLPTLALLERKLFQPAFLAEDFERLKQRMLQAVQQQQKNAGVLASLGRDRLLFGDENRLSLPDSGTFQSLQGITLDDVKRFYQTYYTPAKATVVVVGQMRQSAVIQSLDFLSAWQGEDYVIPPYGVFPSPDTHALYLIDKPDARQVTLRVFRSGPAFDATGPYFQSQLMNFPLGGHFNSRLNQVLREEKGYTYGASSGFVGGKTLGRFEASAEVREDVAAQALQTLMDELRGYASEGPTKAEVDTLQSAFTQARALSYETPYSKLTFLRRIQSYQLAEDFYQQQQRLINTVTPQQLKALAGEMLSADDMMIVVVGNRAAIEEQLQTVGRPVKPLVLSQGQ